MDAECIYSMGILLGINFLSDHIGNTKQEIIFLLLQVRSNFVPTLRRIIQNLTLAETVKTISEKLTISQYLTELFMYRSSRGGNCNICDRYYTKLYRHLTQYHNITKDLITEHATLFQKAAYFYMPSYLSLGNSETALPEQRKTESKVS